MLDAKPKAGGSGTGGGNKPDWFDVAAPTFILLVPFVSFVGHHGNDYFASEVLLCSLGLVTVGSLAGLAMGVGGRLASVVIIAVLATLFVDFQFDWLGWWGKRVAATFGGMLVVGWILRAHLSRIVTAVFLTVLVSTFAVSLFDGGVGPAADGQIREPAPAPRQSARDPNLPVFLHLILDGHIGIEGIPKTVEGGEKLGKKLTDFYLNNGFVVFGGAFSEYANTNWSIPHLLNFSAGQYRGNDFIEKSNSEFRWKLKKNDYFLALYNKGYRLNVSQNTYMNLCGDDRISFASCDTQIEVYKPKNLQIPLAERIRLIMSTFVDRSFFYGELRNYYNRMQPKIESYGLPLPMWDWERNPRLTNTAMAKLERLEKELRKAAPGDFFFAHVMLPHRPFTFGRDCAIRPVRDQLGRRSTNTPATRNERYRHYFEQTECTTQMVGRLLGALKSSGNFENAVVIIHGDHGSRITLADSKNSDGSKMVKSDYVDLFSTLFVAKLNGKSARYDSRMVSIQWLLAKLAANDLHLNIDDPGVPSKPSVFFSAKKQAITRRPMVDLGTPAR